MDLLSGENFRIMTQKMMIGPPYPTRIAELVPDAGVGMPLRDLYEALLAATDLGFAYRPLHAKLCAATTIPDPFFSQRDRR